MRPWASFLFVALGVGASAVAGCATGASGDLEEEPSPASGGTALPPADGSTPPRDSASPTDSASPRDSAVPDAPGTATDARADSADSADSGPRPAGSPCAPVNAIYESPCGFCGKSAQVCLATGWSSAGACSGESTSPDRCMPGGAPTQEACGLCGRRNVLCQPNCTKAQGACTGEVVGGCVPGTNEFLAVGCPIAGEGRDRTCEATCMWGAYSACRPPATDITVPAAVGGVAGIELRFEAARRLLTLLDLPCPTIYGFDTTMYVYARVRNTNARTARVSLWSTLPAGSAADSDTIMAAYAGAADPANRLACVGVVVDDCSPPFGSPAGMCASLGAGLVGTNAVTIAPGATITVYLGEYSDLASPGPIRINARTDSLL